MNELEKDYLESIKDIIKGMEIMSVKETKALEDAKATQESLVATYGAGEAIKLNEFTKATIEVAMHESNLKRLKTQAERLLGVIGKRISDAE